MVERNRLINILCYIFLTIGILIIFIPIWIALVTSTHESSRLMSGITPLLPGDQFIENYTTVLFGRESSSFPPIFNLMVNSLIMALGITIGKVFISLLSAFALIYFRFRFRVLCFWTIFITLMLPVEVRIIPTFQVIAQLNLLNSYTGLILPLIASATATFLFRQFFMTIPEEIAEAARVDGTGPMRFFFEILIPLSKNNILAISVVMFIFGWNQYLWPLVITTEERFYTVVMGISNLITSVDQAPQWHLMMATCILVLLPPVLVIIFLQKQFIKGLIETEK